MKKKIFRVTVYLISICMISTGANAQWYPDTATPEEAAAHDKPFTFLRNEIQKKLCDDNWGTDKTDFKFFKDDPSWHKITRGGGVHRFEFIGGGDACVIEMRENSALYQDNLNKTAALAKSYDAQKDGLSGPKYDAWNRKMQGLADDVEFAKVKMLLNDDRTQGKDLQGYQTNKLIRLQNIPGVGQAILYCGYPDEDDADTIYQAALYIGNFPEYDGEVEGVHFKSFRKEPWTDKAHSGKPIIENMSIWIEGHYYNNIMKVIHSIDWEGLGRTINL